MLTVKLDTTSSLSVRWPDKYRDVVALAEAYIVYENSLPPEAQLRDVPVTAIQEALATAKTAIAAAKSGESDRAAAGERVQQSHNAVRPLLDTAFLRLKADHYNHLAQLEQWGLDTVVNKGKVKVRKPRTQRQRLEFLEAYLVKEGSLPPEERINDPSLETMQAHWHAIHASLANRENGKGQRKHNNRERKTAVSRLLDLLKIAAAIRVGMLYNGLITHELQQWGFEVNNRVVNNKEEPDPVEE